MRYMLIGIPECKQLSLTKGWFVSCLSSSPESAEISVVAQSSACGRSDAVATERLSLFLVACLLSLFFSLCHGGSRAWLYHSWFSVPWWVLAYWLYRQCWEHVLRLLTYLPASRALQSSGCCPWGPRVTWQEKGKRTLPSRYHVKCIY